MDRPLVHLLLYGESGSGKSTGAATFPTPQLVFSFEPVGKEMPYLKRSGSHLEGEDEFGSFTEILSTKTGESLVRVEHYIDGDIGVDESGKLTVNPTAWLRFLRRCTTLRDAATTYRTIIVDSVTWADLAARNLEQYKLNKHAKEPRQWFGGATTALEQTLMIWFGSVRTNVVVVAHVDREKDEVHGVFLSNPKAPGRLRSALASGFNEFYHAFVGRDGQGRPEYLWQTRSDDRWNASSQNEAPDPCVPHYSAIWGG